MHSFCTCLKKTAQKPSNKLTGLTAHVAINDKTQLILWLASKHSKRNRNPVTRRTKIYIRFNTTGSKQSEMPPQCSVTEHRLKERIRRLDACNKPDLCILSRYLLTVHCTPTTLRTLSASCMYVYR